MERCQDLAQESVPPNPTEKDIFKAQVHLVTCSSIYDMSEFWTLS